MNQTIKPLIVYQEGIEALMAGQYFIASEKFDQSEALLPQTEWAAKSALMSAYCFYNMNFYDEAVLNLKDLLNFIRQTKIMIMQITLLQ